MKKPIAALAIALVLIALSWLAWDRKFSHGAKLEAACTQRITDNLASPGTAKFVETHRDGDGYVRLAVDSQNLQGGLVRGYYFCSETAGKPLKTVSLDASAWRALPALIRPQAEARKICLTTASKRFSESKPFQKAEWSPASFNESGRTTVAFVTDEGLTQPFSIECAIDAAGKVAIEIRPASM